MWTTRFAFSRICAKKNRIYKPYDPCFVNGNMNGNRNVYLLSASSNQLAGSVIYSRDTDLKVRVYNLASTGFTPDVDEIQLYAYCDEDLLAFETIDIAPEDALDVISAIKWYCNYMGSPDIELLPDDPRFAHNNEIAV